MPSTPTRPSDRILNGFIQADVGLYDYTSITKDPLGLELFEAGDAEARAEVPHYDTGAWSLYDQFGESDLNYHELLTEFLQHLCERTRKGPPLTLPAAPKPRRPRPPPATGTAPTTTSGGTARDRGAPRRLRTGDQIAGDQIYCTTAQRFTADLKTPPTIALLSTKLRTSGRGWRADVAVEDLLGHDDVRQGSHVVWSNGATSHEAGPSCCGSPPPRPAPSR